MWAKHCHLLIIWLMVFEVLPAKTESPLYTAVTAHVPTGSVEVEKGNLHYQSVTNLKLHGVQYVLESGRGQVLHPSIRS